MNDQPKKPIDKTPRLLMRVCPKCKKNYMHLIYHLNPQDVMRIICDNCQHIEDYKAEE